jgi:hypothetical protein
MNANRGGRRGAEPQHRLHLTALRTDTGHEQGKAGSDATDSLELGRGGGPNHEAHRAAGSPRGRAPRDPGVERLGRGTAGRICRHLEALQFARARIRSPAQYIYETIAAANERLDRLRPEIRIGGDGVGAEYVVERHGLAGGRGADVPALRVGHERDVGRHPAPQPFQGRDPGRPERLEEGQVRLHGRGERHSGIEKNLTEPLYALESGGEALGQRFRLGINPKAQDGTDLTGPHGEPLEVVVHGSEG